MHYMNYTDDYAIENFLRDLLGLYKDRSRLATMFLKDLDKISRAYSIMSNEMSRRVFISYLLSQLFRGLSCATLYRLFSEYNSHKKIDENYNNADFYKYFTKDEEIDKVLDILIAETFVYEQYHYRENELHITADEGDICFDFGAFIGDTALWMIHCRKAHQVYAFEFSEAPYKKLLQYIEFNGLSDKKIIPVKKAISDRDGPVPIERNQVGILSSGTDIILDEAKYVAKYGCQAPVYIDGITVDTFCKEQGVVPDFIKADIEGAERKLITGARETLSKIKPKLAICAYHFPNDIYELPLMIHECNPEYRLYLQRASDELVLFAN